ncbi:MAG TPA: NAD(P)(+) transhydrogenase (Re/Si-specific) subunit beta [Sphingobium sp.]
MSSALDAIALGWAFSALLFLLSLWPPGGVPHRRHRHAAAAGGLILTGTALYAADVVNLPEIVGALGIGGAIGVMLGRELPAHRLPALLTALAGLVGLAAIAVAQAAWLNPYAFGLIDGSGDRIAPRAAIIVGVAILMGAMTCAGGVAALLGPPTRLGRSILPPLAVLAIAGLFLAAFVALLAPPLLWAGMAVAALSAFLLARRAFDAGDTALLALTGAMAGWSVAATAFLLENIGLVVAGGLAGSAGSVMAMRLYHAASGKGLADAQRHP